ncbi:MAG: hypothetical protein WBC22_04430 [Sedimentisphaerales bacterium]
MKTALSIFTALVLCILAGCDGAAEKKEPLTGKIQPLKEGKELLTVDFQEGRSLRYRFVSSRDIALDWDPKKSKTRPGRSSIDKSSESMDMVVSYTPIEVDPYGINTIKATIESVRATRSKSQGGRAARRDAVESLPGKTFTLKVNATGKIEDYSQLDDLIRQTGEKAFRTSSRAGRIKEPDLIADFIGTQWYLWDSVSSIEKPIEGVSVGQSWSSKLSLPTPMVMRKARDVTYTLDEIRQSGKDRLAVISSSYSLADSVPRDWPIPYTGSFQMSGTFGFFRGYKILSLKGQGEDLFNIDAGRTEQYNQQYRMQLSVSLPGPIGASPEITINQKITMQLLN